MRKIGIRIQLGLFLIVGSILFSCSKMNDSYKDFLDNGEIRYPKKLDSIQFYPGLGRLKIEVQASGSEIAECLVIWNDGADSIHINLKGAIEPVSVLLNDLTEGSHTFSFITVDNDGNKSVRKDTITDVYGVEYEKDLNNRIIKSAVYKNAMTQIEWGQVVDSTVVGVELSYTDQNQINRDVFIENDEMITLPDLKIGDTFSYQTLYKPTANAIDTFYSPIQTVEIKYAYDEAYINSLTNRGIISAVPVDDKSTITWAAVTDPRIDRTIITYTDQNNVYKTISVLPAEMSTVLDLSGGSVFTYKTMYIPEPGSLDTLYSKEEEKTIERDLAFGAIYPNFPEDFENVGTKTVYTPGEVKIQSGLWDFNQFLIGTAAADRKNGSRSARSYHGTQDNILAMKFDLPYGASKISFYHAICSSDGPSSFVVQASTDHGSTWQDISGIIANDDIVLQKVTLDNLNITKAVRFRFYRAADGRSSSRFNIDDIEIYSSIE